MNRSRVLLATLATLAFFPVAAAPQGDVQIVQDPIDCWPVDQFLVVQPTFEPPEDIQAAKFYFRSDAQPDYYYVKLTLSRDGGRAIAPKAAPETTGVVYYVELVTSSFSSFRTEEHSAPVASGDECRRRDPEAAYYTGQNPDIAVGSTRFGVPSMPPGFQADGISRFINVSGVSGEAGAAGGISGKTIGIIAGAGGGAVVAALALSGDSGSNITTSGLGGMTSTTTAISTSTATGGGPSSTTTSAAGGGSTSSSSTTVPSSSSTTTVVGSSTTTSGPGSSTTSTSASTTTTSVTTSSSTTSVGSTTTSSGTSSTTTSASTSTTSSASSTTTSSVSSTTTSSTGAMADLSITKTVNPTAIVNQFMGVTYTFTVRNNGPSPANSVTVADAHPSSLRWESCEAGCVRVSMTQIFCNFGTMANGAVRTSRCRFTPTATGNITNTADLFSTTPDPNTSNNTDSATVRVTLNLRAEGSAELDMTYKSVLSIEPRGGAVQGRIVWNGSSVQQTDNTGEFVYTERAVEGENRIEAHWTAPASAAGSWRFDFGGGRDFVPGTIRVESGQVLSQDGYSVVFAMRSGAPSPRFTVEVAAGGQRSSRR